MTRQEEQLCAVEYARTKSPLVAARLVAANMRLVVKIANGYRGPEHDRSDLIQEGNLGLLQGVLRFDPKRGVRLCTYAAWWIRAYILKYTVANWRLVKAGTTLAQRRLFFGLTKQRRDLEGRGIEANSRNVAVAMNLKESDVVVMMERFAGAETSLEAPRGPSENDSWSDVLGGAPGLQPDVQLETIDFARELHRRVNALEATLEGRELAIFRRRLVCDEPATLAELAQDFGVSPERTRQLEGRLKARIRDHLTETLGDALEVGPSRRGSYDAPSPATQ
ncbi:MAG: uncharacterized protein JWM82_66 [Myxococcales bacterium]|nr:uncharacterized protein [Myxococcales bacterium]